MRSSFAPFVVALAAAVVFAFAACKGEPVGDGPPSVDSGIDADGSSDGDTRDTSDASNVDTLDANGPADVTDTREAGAEVGPDGCLLGAALLPTGSYFESLAGTTITIGPLCMAKAETTMLEYRQCNDDGACTSDGLSCGIDATWPELDAGSLDHPINCVTQAQAKAYCAHRGGRLPTFGELQWATRAGSKGSRFPWGNTPGPDATHACWNVTTTCSTGAFPTGDSPQGIHDLAGGVAEWTSTDYDPAPPEVIIGNTSWNETVAGNLEATYFVHEVSDTRGTTVGFRCVWTPK